ncbi:glycosyltransferase family 39 protein [Actinomadura sp. DC4]|uniref:glycosyltransferase family 39 protein n=1 Tax=Actinomadura sp. DC4 TaxID=3055069 RepID=UPI0025AF6E52|nr:glycosyltransferase family 39 protein [Actinomadura sp. DC4]MDN3359841.1 glycosyltransferase family 39 protein [Actinomadura sp. DC4]
MLDTVSEPATSPRQAPAWRPAVILGAVLTLLYGVLLLRDLSVPQPVDHSRYMDAARSFPSPPKDPIFDHQYLRIGLTGPTAVAMKVFGYSEVTYHAFPVAAALLLFASVYAIGVLWFGRLVGALSAGVLGCAGIVVVAGTELLPDLPATALFTAAVALTIAVREDLLPWRRLWLVVIGVLMGWSYLTREFIVFVWPLVPVLLWRRAGRWEWLWGFVPVALTGIGETALNAHLYGDPLKRLHAGSGLGDLPSRPEVAATFHDLPLWVYLWRLPQQLARLAEGPGLLLLLALTLATGAFVVFRRARGTATLPERRAGVFALWVMLLWVPLTLAGGVLDPGRPKLRLQLLRYWYPLFPALVLGGVAALWLAARALRLPDRRRAVAATAVVSCVAVATASLAVAGRPGMPGWAGSDRVRSDALPEFRSWLARSDARTVWVDTKLFRILPIYFVTSTGHRIWHGHMRPMLSSGQPPAGDYVVAYSVGSDACPRCGDTARAVLPSVPPAWRPVMTSHDHLLRVWRVA